nr:MAG TPA: hypothetical protein [Caudoviricetes sp.]
MKYLRFPHRCGNPLCLSWIDVKALPRPLLFDRQVRVGVDLTCYP